MDIEPDEKPTAVPWRQAAQRYGGHLVLLIVGLLLFLGARSAVISGLFEFDLAEPGSESAFAALAVPAQSSANSDAADLPPGDGLVLEPIDLSALSAPTDSSLVPVLNPFTYEGPKPEHTNLFTYTVVRNDTPYQIAIDFGIKEETLLGCNPRLSEESSLMQVGDVLIICPEDGVLHDVSPQDTLEGIANQYSVSLDAIIAYPYNNLEFPYRLHPGTQVFVPGAVREVFVWTPPALPASTGSGSSGGGFPNIATGTFIWPVSSRNISQYYSYFHQGLDVALPEGSAVFASDSGTVSYAGWNNSGYGYLVVLNHGNGYTTYYAHLSAIYVYVGQQVTQGTVIAGTGNTGRSSGPHIHFEIRINDLERVNPLWAGYLN
jgi:murein DD-endopeptidase MepM/ murein hydrolase activator NlpD